MPTEVIKDIKNLKPSDLTLPPPEALTGTFSMDDAPTIGGVDHSRVVGEKEGVIEVSSKPVSEERKEILKKPAESEITLSDAPIVKIEEKAAPKVEEKPEEKKSILKAPADSKVEAKVTPETKGATEKKEIVKPIVPPAKTDEFDYSGFSQQEVVNLKNMSRQSRDYTANLIKQNKELAGLKDSTYLQHPEAYTLSPEYQENVTKVNRALTEGQLWERALLDIRAGKETYQQPIGINEKGQIVLSEPVKPTDRDDIRISNNIMACNQAATQSRNTLQGLPQQFKQRIDQDLQTINQVQAERFSWVADPKILDYTVEVPGLGEKKLGDIKSEFKGMFPVYLRNNIAVDVASNLWITMQIQAAELRQAQQGKQIAEIQKDEIRRGEPSSSAHDGDKGKKIGSGAEFTLDGFPSS
jgi:hypothetical protein